MAKVGALLMSAAMLSITIVDGLAKYLSADFSPLFISWARYAVASCIIVPFAFHRFGFSMMPSSHLGAHFFRTICLVGAMTLYFLSLASIPMATATSAFFISPILATVLAVIFLGERFTTAKLSSLALGVLGMFIITGPISRVEPGILLAIAAGVAFAIYLLATRIASQSSDPVKTLVYQCVVGAAILFPQALWSWQLPRAEFLHLFFAMGVISVVSHLMSIAAFRYAQTSVLAPLVYLELVGAVIIGYYVFQDTPTLTMLAGAALIVLGGLVVTFSRNE